MNDGGSASGTNVSFTVFGFLLMLVLFLLLASGKYASVVVTFLATLLLAMVLLNWQTISPIFIRRG